MGGAYLLVVPGAGSEIYRGMAAAIVGGIGQPVGAILGGVVVRVGDQLIDGSVRGRLERLHTDLTSIAV